MATTTTVTTNDKLAAFFRDPRLVKPGSLPTKRFCDVDPVTKFTPLTFCAYEIFEDEQQLTSIAKQLNQLTSMAKHVHLDAMLRQLESMPASPKRDRLLWCPGAPPNPQKLPYEHRLADVLISNLNRNPVAHQVIQQETQRLKHVQDQLDFLKRIFAMSTSVPRTNRGRHMITQLVMAILLMQVTVPPLALARPCLDMCVAKTPDMDTLHADDYADADEEGPPDIGWGEITPFMAACMYGEEDWALYSLDLIAPDKQAEYANRGGGGAARGDAARHKLTRVLARLDALDEETAATTLKRQSDDGPPRITLLISAHGRDVYAKQAHPFVLERSKITVMNCGTGQCGLRSLTDAQYLGKLVHTIEQATKPHHRNTFQTMEQLRPTVKQMYKEYVVNDSDLHGEREHEITMRDEHCKIYHPKLDRFYVKSHDDEDDEHVVLRLTILQVFNMPEFVDLVGKELYDDDVFVRTLRSAPNETTEINGFAARFPPFESKTTRFLLSDVVRICAIMGAEVVNVYEHACRVLEYPDTGKPALKMAAWVNVKEAKTGRRKSMNYGGGRCRTHRRRRRGSGVVVKKTAKKRRR